VPALDALVQSLTAAGIMRADATMLVTALVEATVARPVETSH